MTETNAERLDRIKNINDLKHVVALGNPTDDGCHPDAVDIERDIDWLIEQAERSEIYQKALMEIGAKYQPPASKIANDSLWIADYKRNG